MKNTISKLGLALALLVVLANTASAAPIITNAPVPDAGSSAALLGLALAGLATVRRFIR